MNKSQSFPKTIEVPATVLDIVEWLERTDRELSSVADGKHTACMSWIEEGPMGMPIGSYIPGTEPVKIALEGYVTVAEGVPGVLLPVDLLVEDPEFRELDGLVILTIEALQPTVARVSIDMHIDAETRFVERFNELLSDLQRHFNRRRVGDARRQARDQVALDMQSQRRGTNEPASDPEGPSSLVADKNLSLTEKTSSQDELASQEMLTASVPGPKNKSPQQKREIVDDWYRVQREMTQEEYVEQKEFSARTLRNYIKQVRSTPQD